MIHSSDTGLKSVGIENLRTESDEKYMQVFVGTGANVNTMSRTQFIAFLDTNLDMN